MRFEKFLAKAQQEVERERRGSPVKMQSNGEVLDVWVYGEIGGWWDGVDALEVNQAIAEHKGSELVVHVNSQGGSVFDGISMFNAIERFSGKSTVINEGFAASAASLVLQAGDERIVEKGSQTMIHKAWTVGIGNADELRELAAVLDGIDEELIALYADKSGETPEALAELLAAETWMGPQAAINSGFADRLGGSESAESAKVPNTYYAGLRLKVG